MSSLPSPHPFLSVSRLNFLVDVVMVMLERIQKMYSIILKETMILPLNSIIPCSYDFLASPTHSLSFLLSFLVVDGMMVM